MKIDREIYHPIHPKHRLRLQYTETPFNCDGCKEAGIGLKYECMECDFDLHKICAVASPTIYHPFYPKCVFQFFYKPPGSERRLCDGCGKDVQAFMYHCKKCGFDLHPCCANLPTVLDDGEHDLYLSLKLTSPCHKCGRKGSGWAYRTDCKTYNLHVACVKELLVESWQVMYLNIDKNKMKELQTRLPSLKGTLKSHHKGHKHGKVMKCCQMAGGAVKIIVSAILGDPTAIIGAAIGSFISK
ncbi:unnamed protein product [Rhodiola kirilowii]